MMKDGREIVGWANGCDTEGLKEFLTTQLTKPLICIGSGGSLSVCELVVMMYEALGGVAKAVTPYSVYAMSDTALSRCKFLLVSSSGHNKDIVRIAKHLMELVPDSVANLTTADSTSNDLKAIIPAERSFNFKSDLTDGFISVNSVIANYALIIKALKGECDTDLSYTPDENGAGIADETDLSGIRHLMILYGGWGKPAAIDLESKLVESGVATCAVSDYRNFCHGRFIFAGNHCGHEKKAYIPDDTAVVMLTTPREANFAAKIRAVLPDRCRVITLHTDRTDSTASLDLLYQSSALAGAIADAHGINPLSPPNHGKIDKRYPQNIPFISDIKSSGPLTV